MTQFDSYDKVCDICADNAGGKCLKDLVVYNTARCVVCGEEMPCLSVRDYQWPACAEEKSE